MSFVKTLLALQKCYKHIHDFFARDVLQRNNIAVKYSATNQMLVDFYTNPSQGKHFLHIERHVNGCHQHISKGTF